MTLELLIRQPGERRENTVVLLPQAPGSGADVIARSLADSLDEGHWRLLPAPSTEAGVLVQRAWHRDAWLAMPTSEQGSVALVTGPTAAYLAPVLADAARTVVLVRGPLAAVGMTDEPLPERSALERLTKAPASDIPPALGRIANPQSRALLAPWHDPSELVVSPGPPERRRSVARGAVRGRPAAPRCCGDGARSDRGTRVGRIARRTTHAGRTGGEGGC